MAYSAPTTRSDGYVVDASEWNKNTVDNPIALRSGAIALASQAANDIVYASSASQLARLAAGTAGQVLSTNGTGSAPSWVSPQMDCMCGRLTLTSATPVPNTDVTAAGTLYYTPYKGNVVTPYNGSGWQQFTIAELSISAPAAANQMYDVFLDYNSGTPALALVAWTNDTTRATALTTQNGVLVKTGATTQRYLGSVRTVTASQFNDSLTLRHVWNYDNRVLRPLQRLEGTASWNYTTATVRQANGSTSNQVSIVCGVAEEAFELRLCVMAVNDGGNSISAGIGEGATTSYAAGAWTTGTSTQPIGVDLIKIPAVGYQYYSWNESSTASGTTTWYGTNTVANGATQSGLRGWIRG